MKKLLALLLICLLCAPAALANEYAAIRLDAPLSYAPARVSVQDAIHWVTQNAARDGWEDQDTFLDWQLYSYAWCEVDLFPRLTAIGMEDVHAYAYEYVLNGKPHFMYLREDQRVLMRLETNYDFGLILWADDSAVLPSQTLLAEIASTLRYDPAELYNVAR